MTKPQVLSLGIGFSGAVVAALGALAPWPWKALAAWTSLACFLVAGAYALNRPEVFGKRDGALSRWRMLPTLPYLIAFWISCAWMRLKRRYPTLHEVAPGLYVSGRLRGSDLSADVELVLDLTCEFSEPPELRRLPGYRSVLALDGHSPPDADRFLSILAEVESCRGGVLVHCESGIGRAPAAAALVLVQRGVVDSPRAAIELIRKTRPMVRPSRSDYDFMERMVARLRGPYAPPGG